VTPRFDLFKMKRDGSVLWVGTADDIEEAKTNVARHPDGRKSCFLILDQATCRVTIRKPDKPLKAVRAFEQFRKTMEELRERERELLARMITLSGRAKPKPKL
jgi:hypothetical protein